jgi:hypothetical protein
MLIRRLPNWVCADLPNDTAGLLFDDVAVHAGKLGWSFLATNTTIE